MDPCWVRGLSHTDREASAGNLVRGKPGPCETIGDLIRYDRLSWQPGWGMAAEPTGGWPNPWNAPTYETLSPDTRRGGSNVDDDGDGKIDERGEGDAWFTAFANMFTTRNSVFTIEILAELTEPPYHPGRAMPQHQAYKVRSQDIHARKHLLAVLDRTPTFQVKADGSCDFTGPVKVLIMRWAQTNK